MTAAIAGYFSIILIFYLVYVTIRNNDVWIFSSMFVRLYSIKNVW